MTVSATEAKNLLGQLLEQCQNGPIWIEKCGRRHNVPVAAARHDELVQAQCNNTGPSDAGKVFAAHYGAWVHEQRQHFEQLGVWNEEFRSW